MSRYDRRDERVAIERTRARKRGGSFELTLRVESARAIGLEPGDVDHDDEIEFLVSEEASTPRRLIFDLIDAPTASD